MLETKGLVKIYRPKKGVPVKALDGVSIRFPDRGMVFLLGKSGCGKSTLLNLLGGLDKYDDGEIIIKGVSSKKFSQAYFDSYRNTYVGFIFQEYNILDEFTVGANIALALELQGKKATDAEINKILCEVDLDGYGARNPNELSGGQKQRVAIARALVKNPKIIMADEPSGALDSATGKQVFDTLKKLSKEKLVIVVSHDRDSAYEYADRIIELADGRVISDTSLTETADETADNGISFEGRVAKIPIDYRLTEEDRLAINQYLEKLQSGAEIELVDRAVGRQFAPTDTSKILNTDSSPFKLIKSKLSLKHAFKIGASGLKFKKFRLVMTILLSCVAFILFGLVDTFSAYNHINACTDSVYDSEINYATLVKSVKYGEGIDSYWSNWNNRISKEELAVIEQETGIDLSGVVTPNGGLYLSFELNIDDVSKLYDFDGYGQSLYTSNFSGVVELNESQMKDLSYTLLAGKLPDGSKKEIAISEHIFRTFELTGYCEDKGEESVKIKQYSDMVGKTLTVEGEEYTVTGVIDTHLDWDRYKVLLDKEESSDTADLILDYALLTEFASAVSNNYTGMMIVGEGGMEAFVENRRFPNDTMGSVDFYGLEEETGKEIYIHPAYLLKLQDVDADDVTWLDGKERTSLENDEIIITPSTLYQYANDDDIREADVSKLSLTMNMYIYGESENSIDKGIKIVGILNTKDDDFGYDAVVLSDACLEKFLGDRGMGEYDVLIGAMPKDKGDIKELVTYCYTEDEDTTVRYELVNPACFELDALNEVILVLAKVFLYVGIGFALFAAILLSNFIATSVSYKKQEIGILRAIGSRGNDVFRIFFAEAFIIAMINFILASLATAGIVTAINSAVRTEVGLLITFLDFSVRQVALLFVISVAVAAIASFLPVKKIASKRPIDAIKEI